MLVTGSSARTREGRNPFSLYVIDCLTSSRFLSKEEDIVGPYKFGVYDVLVLPPSFPYGGMVSCSFPQSITISLTDWEGKRLSFFFDAQCVLVFSDLPSNPDWCAPALLAGDRSLVDVVVHELTHSWFGNGIT